MANWAASIPEDGWRRNRSVAMADRATTTASAAIAHAIQGRRTTGPAEVGAPGDSKGPSSISSRASRMSDSRRLRSFSRHLRSSRRTLDERVLRESAPVRVRAKNRGYRVRDRRRRSNVRCAGEHLVQHAPECPDVAALVGRLPPRLLGAHVGRGAEDHAGARAASS